MMAPRLSKVREVLYNVLVMAALFLGVRFAMGAAGMGGTCPSPVGGAKSGTTCPISSFFSGGHR